MGFDRLLDYVVQMWNQLGCVALIALISCKAKENVSAEQPTAAANAAAAASAGLAAVALAQAASAAAAAAAASTVTPASSAAAAATVSAAASAKPVAVVDGSGFTAQVANQLGRLGFSTGTNDLLALGRDKAALLNGLGRLTAQPTALSAIFNSDKVVSPFMKRADIQEFCRDPERLKQVLPYVLGSAAARTWVSSPEAIKALTSSKLGLQFQACPAFQALAKQPRTLANAAQGNASASAVISDPNLRAELERLKIRQDTRPLRGFKKAAR
jgi:hypothetical protein